MRNLIVASLLLSASAIPASAVQGIRVAPGVRAGASCFLKLNSETVYNGLCNVIAHGTDTVINTGSTTYYIHRDYQGSFTGYFTDDTGENYGDINANGSCWTGRRVSFCAE